MSIKVMTVDQAGSGHLAEVELTKPVIEAIIGAPTSNIYGIQKHTVGATDPAAVIPPLCQLEMRGSITVEGEMTIEGKLYVTEELGV